MRTKESLWGFFASDPQLSFNEDGEARLFAWIGQEQFERNPDGSFTQGETKFYPFKMFRRSAEHAYEKFARGDTFVASGHVQKFSYEKDGETISGEEFIATHIGPDAADVIDITAPIGENIRRVAKRLNESVADVTVCILDRPRHSQLISEVREAGARIRLISDGDVAGAISACRPESGTDILAGIGGTPEGIIAAAAIRCMGGAIQAVLAPTDDDVYDPAKFTDATHTSPAERAALADLEKTPGVNAATARLVYAHFHEKG